MRGRKGVIRGSITSQEDKTSNGCPETNQIVNSGLHANDAISVEALIIGDNTPVNSSGSQSIKENSKMINVRRSGRIKDSTLPGGTRVANLAMEHVNSSKNYKDGAPYSQLVSNLPGGKERDFEDGTQVQPGAMPLNSVGLQSMKEKSEMTNVRRSGRVKISRLPGGIKVAKPAMENANTSKNYKKGGPRSPPVSNLPVGKEQDFEGGTQVQPDSTMPNTLEEKINYLVQAVDVFKSQMFEQSPEGSNEDKSSDFSYKTLYLDSLKKIEALIAENFELVKKLEYARGKVSAYEKMNDGMSAAKEVLFLRPADAAALNLSPQSVQPLIAPPTTNAPSDAAVLPGETGNSKKRKAGKAG